MGPHGTLRYCRTSNREQFTNPCVNEWIPARNILSMAVYTWFLRSKSVRWKIVQLFRCITCCCAIYSCCTGRARGGYAGTYPGLNGMMKL